MRLSDYDYALPHDRIAQAPASPRDSARLLVLDREPHGLSHHVFSDLPDLLAPGDLLVLNDTRVVPARLRGVRAGSGGRAEVFLVRRLAARTWKAMVRPGRAARPGTTILVGEARAPVRIAGRDDGGLYEVVLPDDDADALMRAAGELPLPPYIHAALADPEDYQTVYARRDGAVAAPTAGLHFTARLFEALSARGIERTTLTLHVGPGTFRAVAADDPRDHRMDAEFCEISAEAIDTIRRARENKRRIVAVGTTVVRALETAARSELRPTAAWTDLFILPGHRYALTDALITNFHLPKTTLLMLVCAFAGQQRTMAAYQAAIDAGYRFYSFGDAMLIR